MPSASITTSAASVAAADLVFELVGFHQAVHEAGGTVPVEGTVAVAGSDEPRARIEHLVLRMAGAKLGANRVPRGFQKFHLLFRTHLRGPLRHLDDPLQFRVLEVVN
jgi:hypothetical protein